MREPLEIRLLGSFEVVAGGTRAEVGGSKRQALLALLALRQGRVVDVDALVEGLWGEELPAAPRNALHHHIARLRAALPTPISPATKGASPGLLPRWREAVELVHRVLQELVGIGQLPEADGLDDPGPKQFLGVPRGPDGSQHRGIESASEKLCGSVLLEEPDGTLAWRPRSRASFRTCAGAGSLGSCTRVPLRELATVSCEEYAAGLTNREFK